MNDFCYSKPFYLPTIPQNSPQKDSAAIAGQIQFFIIKRIIPYLLNNCQVNSTMDNGCAMFRIRYFFFKRGVLRVVFVYRFCYFASHKQIRFFFTANYLYWRNNRINYWRMPGSNRRPPACRAGAIPIELIPQSEAVVPWVLCDNPQPLNPVPSHRVNSFCYKQMRYCFYFLVKSIFSISFTLSLT